FSVAGQADYAAQKFNFVKLKPFSLNAKLDVGFFKRGPVRRAEFQELEQVQQRRQVVELALGHVDAAASVQGGQFAALPLEVDLHLRLAAQLGVRAESVAAGGLLQLQLHAVERELVAQDWPKPDSSPSRQLAVIHLRLDVLDLEEVWRTSLVQ